MKYKAICIPAEGEPQVKTLDGYEETREALNSGWLEGLRLSDRAMSYIDEEGKLKNLPVNYAATSLCHSLNALPPDDYIVGPMVIFGTLNEEGEHDGDEHDVPDEFYGFLNLENLESSEK